MRISTSLATVLCLLGMGIGVSAQTITGAFTGTLTDSSGAVVPNVKVTATSTGTSVAHTSTTNESGIYNLLFLQAGDYTLAAEVAGFKKATLGPFHIDVNQTARVDI